MVSDAVLPKQIEVFAEGLAHSEGPDVLPDGRVVFAEAPAADVSMLEHYAHVEQAAV